MNAQLLRFLIVGIVNTGVGLTTIFALKALADWGDVASNAGGYAVGLCVSFVLNRRWTFRHEGVWNAALGRFLAVFAFSYAINLCVMLGLRDLAGASSYLAQSVAMIVYTLVFFLGSRHVAFRSLPRTEVKA